MHLSEAVKVLVLGQAKAMPILRATDLGHLFPNDKPAALKRGIGKLVEIGLLSRVTKGIYLNRAAPFMGMESAGRLVAHIRPYDLSYLSYESALSQHGVIDQIPFVSTFATTGRRGNFDTPVAVMELTHTRRTPKEIFERTIYREDIRCRIASPDLALEDQHRLRPVVVDCYVDESDLREARADWRAIKDAA